MEKIIISYIVEKNTFYRNPKTEMTTSFIELLTRKIILNYSDMESHWQRDICVFLRRSCRALKCSVVQQYAIRTLKTYLASRVHF